MAGWLNASLTGVCLTINGLQFQLQTITHTHPLSLCLFPYTFTSLCWPIVYVIPVVHTPVLARAHTLVSGVPDILPPEDSIHRPSTVSTGQRRGQCWLRRWGVGLQATLRLCARINSHDEEWSQPVSYVCVCHCFSFSGHFNKIDGPNFVLWNILTVYIGVNCLGHFKYTIPALYAKSYLKCIGCTWTLVFQLYIS